CGIDQCVIRLTLQTAFNHRLQIFIFNLKFFERKIIHVNDKLVIPVFDLGNDIIEILELVLVHFDHTQSFFILLIQYCLDGSGFYGSRVPQQQAVIRLSFSYKILCNYRQLLLWYLISYQIIQSDMGNLGNRNNPGTLFSMFEPKSLVKPEFPYPELLVKLGHDCFKFFRRRSPCKVDSQRADPVSYPTVVDMSFLPRSLIVK